MFKAGNRGFQEVENQLVVGLASCLLSWRRAEVCKFVTAGMGIEPIPVHQVKIDSFSFCTCRSVDGVSKSKSYSFYQHQAKTVRDFVPSLLPRTATSAYPPQPHSSKASKWLPTFCNICAACTRLNCLHALPAISTSVQYHWICREGSITFVRQVREMPQLRVLGLAYFPSCAHITIVHILSGLHVIRVGHACPQFIVNMC